jgi:hypothetical protein
MQKIHNLTGAMKSLYYRYVLFSDCCLSTVHLEMAMADTEVLVRGNTLWSVDKSPEDSTHCYTYWNLTIAVMI